MTNQNKVSKISMLTTFIWIIQLSLFPMEGIAQISQGGKPLSFKKDINLRTAPTEYMASVNIELLRTEDEENADTPAPYRFGYVIDTDLNLKNSGVWDILPSGDRIWRLQIECDDAKSVNINYAHFELPQGARFFVYGDKYRENGREKRDILGAFTSHNNKPYLKFSTMPVRGTTTTLEYFEPAEYAGQGIIQIESVVHGYKDFFSGLERISGSCNLDVICGAADGYPQVDNYRNEIRAAVGVFTSNNSGFCSGTLTRAASGCTPYVLTADHCGVGSAGDSNNNLFVFNFENSTCRTPGSAASGGAGDGSIAQSVSGMIVRAASDGGVSVGSDFALVELSAQPPASYNAYYSGWSRDAATPGSAIAIHHPNVDEKRISFEDDPLDATNYSNSTSAANGTHWLVPDWDVGTTEPGSSGSGLFNAQGLLIGQLSGGGAACSGAGNNGQPDWYGRMWYNWDQNNGGTGSNIGTWLDPNGSGLVSLPGSDDPCGGPPTCTDGVQNGDEEGIDCGGATCPACPEPTCTDGIQNGDETGVDCGGATCPACPTCTDGVQNGDEIGVDCGGADCPACPCNDGALVFTIILDDYPEETSWTITDVNGTTITASNGTYASEADGATVTENICLPDGCFDFTLNDSYGDGICCGYGIGSYTLADVDGNILFSSTGEFAGAETTNVCIESACPSVISMTTTVAGGLYQAGLQVNCQAPLDAGTQIQFRAGQIIRLEAGTIVPATTDFEATIRGCQ